MAEPKFVRDQSNADSAASASWASVGVVVLVVVAAGIGVVALSGGSDSDERRAESLRRHTTAAPQLATGANVSADLGRVPFRAAATKGDDIAVFAAPDGNAAPMATLPKKTEYLLPRTLLAFDQYQDWLHVYLPTRPNSFNGMGEGVRRDGLHSARVADPRDLADHHLWLFHNGVVDFDTGTAIGSQQYPTPTGTFYITDPLDLHSTPNLGYGVFALGLSGHSDVLTEFGGGDGQIAIHGTNNPGDIGQDVSHGCVRIINDDIERLSTLPLGTPVVIT